MVPATAQKSLQSGLERAGSRALSVFVHGLNAAVLRAHADRPLSSAELEGRLGWAAKASLRASIAELCELGALEREGRQPVVTKLTPGGRDLLRLADVLERWLSHSPFGALDLNEGAARGTVRALVGGWDSTIVQALAERPRRLADLSRELPDQSYAALKRRFAKLRTAALVDCLDDAVRSPEYEATALLRRAAAPLSFAVRWEREHAPFGPLDEGDLEAVLLLALSLVKLPRVSGSCLLAVARQQSVDDAPPAPMAIRLVAQKGAIVEASLAVAPMSETWALASTDGWLDAIVGGQLSTVRMRGPAVRLAEAVVQGIHRTLFPDP